MTWFAALLTFGFLLTPCVAWAQEPSPAMSPGPARYDVLWESPSGDHTGSMPIGNGEIGLNVWVEESGDILFTIGMTDSWDDNGRLLKVGRIRISYTPQLVHPLRDFSQKLTLGDGTITIGFGGPEDRVECRLWVDAHHPLIHLRVHSTPPVSVTAAIELWRTERYQLPSLETSDPLWGAKDERGEPVQVFVEPDSLLTGLQNRIGWFHHNIKSVGPEVSARVQGLQAFPRPDPLLHRTFGSVITARNGIRENDSHLRSPAATTHDFKICVLTRHPATPGEWLRGVDSALAEAERHDLEALRRHHEEWWGEFWNRSWIHVTPAGRGADADSSDAFAVSRAYALQRYMNACAGRGRFPIKFNGSIFTVPFPGKPGDADYRQWGPGYWWQNTRLPYVSMCASGDYDLMQPLFRMYGKDLMPLFRYRTRLYMNHDGAFIPECILFWGDVFAAAYGWTPFEERSDKLQENGYHKWEWVSGPELAWMMLDYYEYTLDAEFLQKMLLPTARDVLTFFDQHYGADQHGILVLHPSQALETWWDCTNPMPELSGLHAVLDRLLALPKSAAADGERAFWRHLKGRLPALPTRVVDGTTMLAPAERFADKKNIENPELYAVFPFRLVSFEKANRDLGLEAFRHRWDRGNFGWRQDDIFAAYLGLADTAREYSVNRATTKDAGSRFPAFWGPNYDWIPDQDHGSILLKTLQAMVMQTDGRKIHLCPAWPRQWNVHFRLHAPYQTIIEGRSIDGRCEILNVTPEARRGDIEWANHSLD